jgi:hypothetical protein
MRAGATTYLLQGPPTAENQPPRVECIESIQQLCLSLHTAHFDTLYFLASPLVFNKLFVSLLFVENHTFIVIVTMTVGL